jgi:hypothetical protein
LGVFAPGVLGVVALAPLLAAEEAGGVADADADAAWRRGAGDADAVADLPLACFCTRCGLARGLRSETRTCRKT